MKKSNTEAISKKSWFWTLNTSLGVDIDQMSDEQLAEVVEKITVFARNCLTTESSHHSTVKVVRELFGYMEMVLTFSIYERWRMLAFPLILQ